MTHHRTFSRRKRLTDPQRAREGARLLARTTTYTAVVGSLLVMFVDVESVIVSGSLLFLQAVLLAILASRSRTPGFFRLACMHAGFCVLLVALVNIFRWSPSDAEVPFSVLTPLFGLGMYFKSRSMLAIYPRYDDSVCQVCGYPLQGLSTPRCPECGTPFPADRLEPYRDTDRRDGLVEPDP